MQWQIERRATPSTRMRVLAPLFATVLTLIAASILFAAVGHNPARALYAFFVAPLSSLNGLSELCLKAAPLILIACGLSIGFRANVWNIGAEGQLIMGAIGACGLALFVPVPGPLLLPAMIVTGMVSGMLWAAIPAALKAYMNTNEILVSLMMTYLATLLLSWLVHGPLRDPMGFNYPQTALLGQEAMFSTFGYYRLNSSVWLTVIAVIATWIFAERSFAGYRMAVDGAAPAAARYAGFGRSSSVFVGLLSGGAAAGIAGMAELSGPLGQLSPNISPGYGFAAIIVAFIGRLNAFGIVLAGFLMSLLFLGGEAVQITLGLPAALTRVMQGILLIFLLGADFFVSHRLVRAREAV